MLEDHDMERLREVFVTRRECDNTTNEIYNKLSNDNARLAVIEHRLGTITWLLMTVCGGVIATLIKLFMGA